MTQHTVAVENYVWTPTGPTLVSSVKPDHELTVVERDGTFTTASVRSVQQVSEPKPSIRLLTGAGDLEVPLDAIVTTRTGPRRVAEVVREVHSGRSEKLEMLRTADLPRQLEEIDPSPCARAALSQLGGVVRIPRSAAEDRAALARIRTVVRTAGVDHEEVELGRWLVVVCHADGMELEPSTPSTLASVAGALHALTAWESDGESWRSRLPLDDVSTRTIILAGLSAAGQEFRTHWSPLYWPVEFRLSLTEALGSHWKILAMSAASGAQRLLSLEAGSGASLILGRTLVRG